MYKLIFILVAILAVAGGLLIGALNSDTVTLDLLWAQLAWPLGLVVVVALSFGVLLGVAGTWVLQVLPARMALRRERAAAARSAPDIAHD